MESTKTKSAAGRKTKRDTELEKALLEALMVGHTDKDACILAGISTSTFYEWIREFSEFSDTVKKVAQIQGDQSIYDITEFADSIKSSREGFYSTHESHIITHAYESSHLRSSFN